MDGVRRRLTVHVGTPKAGSTTLQHLLGARRGLLARLGIHVPRAGSPDWGLGHQGLARELGRRAKGSGQWRARGGGIRGSRARRFVLSHETFTHPPRAEGCIERLLELEERENLEVDVVAYVRPQWQRVEAGYAQRVRHGRAVAPLEREVQAVFDEGGYAPHLDYNVLFEPFRAAFGERVRVYPLQSAVLPQGLCAHFLELLGVSGAARAARGLFRANSRPGAVELEVLRLVNARLGGRRPGGEPVHHRLALLPALLEGDAPYAGLTPGQIGRIDARFGPANARFARAYGIDAGGVLFRDPPDPAERRPHSVRWRELPAGQRRLVSHYVRSRVGVDLEPAGAPHGTAWRVRARIARYAAARGAGLAVRGRRIAGYRNGRTVWHVCRLWMGGRLR